MGDTEALCALYLGCLKRRLSDSIAISNATFGSISANEYLLSENATTCRKRKIFDAVQNERSREETLLDIRWSCIRNSLVELNSLCNRFLVSRLTSLQVDCFVSNPKQEAAELTEYMRGF